MRDQTALRAMLDAGLSAGESATIIRQARATIRPDETLPLAISRVIRLEVEALTNLAVDLAAASNVVAYLPSVALVPDRRAHLAEAA